MSSLSVVVVVALGALLALRAGQSLLVVRGILRLPAGFALERVDHSPVLGSTLSHRPLTAVLFVPEKEDTRAALESIKSIEATGYPGVEILVLAQRPNDLSEIRDHFGLGTAEPVVVNADSGHRYEQWTAETTARLRLIRGPFRDSESLAVSFASWAALFPLLLWLTPGVLVNRSALLRLGETLERDRGVAAAVGGSTCSPQAGLLTRLECWWNELRRLELYGLGSEACALALSAPVVLFRRSALVDAEVFDSGDDSKVTEVLERLVESRTLGAGEWRLAACPHASSRWIDTAVAATSPTSFRRDAKGEHNGVLPADWSWVVRFYAKLRRPWLHRFELLVALLVIWQAATGALPMAGVLVAVVLLLVLPALLSTLANVWEQLTVGSLPGDELVERLETKSG